MSKFEYTLPSGAKFMVDGPASATQDQADRVFYEQVASGSLIGYTPGQTLTSLATRLTKFELSRLERGTAGVDTVIVYAISPESPQGVTTIQLTSDTTTQTLLSAVQNLPVPASMPSLSNVPLTDAIDVADIALIQGDDLEPRTVGPLNPFQVKKLLAQISSIVNQESDQLSLDKGIGRFGFTAYSLEQTGYVKPGTSIKYFSTSTENFVAVMSSPSVWTGRDGIRSLDDLLASPETQNKIQVEIMQQSYQQLTALGAIVEPPKPAVSLSTGQVYTNAGLVSVGSLTGTNVRNSENIVAGFTALNLSTIGSGTVNRLSPVVGDLSKLQLDGVIQGVTGRLNGDIGSLVANASKFGSQATALWAKSGNLSLNSLGSLTTGGLNTLGNLTGQGVNAITGSLSGGFNNISTSLTNLVPPNLSNLTGSLNVLGKAGSFATNFANPLSSLNNIGGALQGQLTGALGNLQGQATAALGNLQGQATAALGQAQALAGNLANLSLPANLFGGAGDLVSGTQIVAGFNNTVNRKTLDAAFNRILGSTKIPVPVYEYPSLPSVSARLDIAQAQNFLKNIQGQGQALLGQGQAIASQAQALGGRFLG
jgi:hypothetical protein